MYTVILCNEHEHALGLKYSEEISKSGTWRLRMLQIMCEDNFKVKLQRICHFSENYLVENIWIILFSSRMWDEFLDLDVISEKDDYSG